MKNFTTLLLLLVAGTAWADQNVVIVLDDSGSMEQIIQSQNISRMEIVKSALAKVIADLPPDTNLGVVLLNGQWQADKWLVPLGPLDKSTALAKVQGIGPMGGTPLGGCMKAGADALLALRQKERYGTYRLLVATDGEATDQGLVDSYTPDIVSRGIIVDAIGIDMRADHTLATKVNNYRRADDEEQLTKAISATFAETSADKAVAEEDFNILAAIPDEMAVKALQALQASGNQPIGELPQPVIDDKGNVKFDQSGNVVVQSKSGYSFGFYLVVGLGVFVCLLIVFLFFLKLSE